MELVKQKSYNKCYFDNTGFIFIGNKYAHLAGFRHNKFILRPYFENLTIEYDFDGNYMSHRAKGDDELNLKEYREYNVKKIAKTFHHAWFFKRHGMQVDTFESSMNHTSFSNQNDFPIMLEMNDKICAENCTCCEIEEWICGFIKLTRWSRQGVNVFITSLIEDNSIISLFHNDNNDYLDGDSGTSVYVLNDKNILMWNDGDCPSVLLIKNHLIKKNRLIKNKKELNAIPGKIVECALDLRKKFKIFDQSIIDLFYSIIDNERYSIYQWGNLGYCIKKIPVTKPTKKDVRIYICYKSDVRHDTLKLMNDDKTKSLEICITDMDYKLTKKIYEFVKNNIDI